MTSQRCGYTAVIESPLGRLGVVVTDDAVTRIDVNTAAPTFDRAEDHITQAALTQLRRYFVEPQAAFSLPLRPAGTAFQKRVWQALLGIPPGTAETYGQLAERLGSSARAVGGACRANPIPIVIPCHRVVARDGVGGYAGQTAGRMLGIKRWLLAHEQKGGQMVGAREFSR